MALAEGNAAVAAASAPADEESESAPAAPGAAIPATSSSVARPGRLPLARVKALVKADPDVSLASQEAIFILARAAELFVETIAKDAYIYAQQGKRKTLQRKDLDNAIEAMDEFAFLEELVTAVSLDSFKEGLEKLMEKKDINGYVRIRIRYLGLTQERGILGRKDWNRTWCAERAQGNVPREIVGTVSACQARWI